ncbi:cysteine-rich repeat secretory protein 38-like [Lycium ferocissimum]|uniref:cysteine-rich repeat secretory protein 38-like n=1 Tax=Lycium ferocissimum TaxID=112874 RepID=UPI002814F3CC|nr:cysteine-rich repeat secretory protein 38-like [Lycium ferocissimum]
MASSVLALLSTQMHLIFLLPWLLVSVKSQIIKEYNEMYSCPNTTGNYTDGSNYQSNLNTLLYRSLYNIVGNAIYAKASEGEDPDKVHGVFLCRGDVAPKDCQNCIDVAAKRIQRVCPLKKQAIIWYDERCMIRYSNVFFASTFDDSVSIIFYGRKKIPRPEQFKGILSAMFDNLTTQATSIIPNQKYAANSVEISQLQRLYGMVQCLPDLSALDCRACLRSSFYLMSKSNQLSDAKVPNGGRVVYASCSLRYDLRPFFSPGGRRLKAPPPSTSGSQTNEDEVLKQLVLI